MSLEEGQIDKEGFLYIRRKGILKKQKCPWDVQRVYYARGVYCGDTCPLFEEGTDNDIYLNCGGELTKYTVEDLR